MTTAAQGRLLNRDVVRDAVIASFRKLDPRHVIRNPVMFVVEIGRRHHDGRLADPGLRRCSRWAAGTSRPGSRSPSRSGCG